MTTGGPASLLFIIPAYNEEEALPGVLAELAAAYPDADVVVIDDGSADATAAVARDGGAVVLQLPYNLGIGGALRTGFRYAVRKGYQRGVQFDADGQHHPDEVPALLAGLDAGADMVVGSRFSDGKPPYKVGRLRKAAMGILTVTMRRLAGKHFSDTSSGFRAFSRPVLEFFAVTVAPGTTAPELSTTVPRMLPRNVWAAVGTASRAPSTSASVTLAAEVRVNMKDSSSNVIF